MKSLKKSQFDHPDQSINPKEVGAWSSLPYDEKIKKLKEGISPYSIVLFEPDWAIIETKYQDRTMIFHVPSGMFRMFKKHFKPTVKEFSELTDKVKDRILKEIIFES